MEKENVHKIRTILNLIQDLPLSNQRRGKTLFITTGKRKTLSKNTSGWSYLITAKAFTLIELLVVVLIIGILAAVALPQYQKAVVKSRYAALKPLVQAIAEAQEIYYLENNKYTVKLNDLPLNLPPSDNLQADTDTRQQLGYDWGFCGIEVETTEARVYCRNAQGRIGYGKSLLYSPRNPGKQRCVDYTDSSTSVQSAVCKAESGLTTGTSSGGQLQYNW